MATQASATAPERDPARARGLRRKRGVAPCPPVEATSLPVVPSAVEVLALLTRVRSVRIATAGLDPSRLYDLRAFKSAWVELAYLHRLAAGGRHGGTVVTSMRQLVAGLAPLHPVWKLSGDSWEDRDRHHRSVRRRLSALAAADLLDWRIGVDEDLEERRTELVLRPVPELLPDELAAAASRLEQWAGRYDPDLNSGSSTGITDVKHAASPLTASERQRRGCQRAREKARARRATGAVTASHNEFAPPLRGSDKSENNLLAERPANVHEIGEVCCAETRVTRACPGAGMEASSASIGLVETASPRGPGSNVPSGLSGLGLSGLLGRVRVREEARSLVVGVIAEQALGRAGVVAGWSLERGWPGGRLREAWVVWRFGAGVAAEWGAGPAGRVDADDLACLRRAVGRYERHAAARPEGFPQGGLAALAQIAAVAAERGSRPRVLRFGIRALDQLSRRMRAVATARDPERRERLAARARRRQAPPPPGCFDYRRPGSNGWPAWVALDEHGDPILFMDGHFQVAEHKEPPARDSPAYQGVLRDARLLLGLWPQHEGDGRLVMAIRNQQGVELAPHAVAGPYQPPSHCADHADREIAELARVAGLTHRDARRVDPDIRSQLLGQLEGEQEQREAAQRRERWHTYLAKQQRNRDES
jgi:hypothetical protein